MPIRSFVLGALVTAWCAGCGASSPPPEVEPQADLPRIDGRPALDRPLAASSGAIQRAFERFEEIRAVEAPSCVVDAAELATCLRSAWMPWLARRMEAIEEIVLTMHAAAATPAEVLLVAIVHALSVDDVFRAFERIEVADDVPEDIRDAMRQEIAMTARTFASRAKLAYAECTGRASAAPEIVREWEEVCSARADELDEFVQRTPERVRTPPAPRTAEMPPECRSIERVRAPVADPPNEGRPRRVALVLDEQLLAGEARARLLDAIYERVDAHVELPLIARRELAEAEQNHAERRLTRRGPVCGRAPPLELILQQRNPNLVLASVSTIEIVEGTPRHQLIVSFWRPGAAEPHGDMPQALGADIRGEVDEATLLDAVGRLGVEVGGGLGLMGMLAEGPSVRVGEIDDESAWLAIDESLQESEVRAALGACVGESSSASVRLSVRVTREGASSDVAVDPVTLPDGADADAVRQCLTAAFTNVRWPCPRSGRPEPVSALVCIAR